MFFFWQTFKQKATAVEVQNIHSENNSHNTVRKINEAIHSKDFVKSNKSSQDSANITKNISFYILQLLQVNLLIYAINTVEAMLF